MKVVDYDIQWGGPYMNQVPRVEVLLDEELPDLNETLFVERDGYYIGELPIDNARIFRHYYKKVPGSPSNGFGGSHYKVKMKDGTERTLVGPWSTGAYAIGPVYPEFDGMVDTTIYTPRYLNTGLAGFVMPLSDAKALTGDDVRWTGRYPYLESEGPKFMDDIDLAPCGLSSEQAFIVSGSFNEVNPEFVKNHPEFNRLKWMTR